MLLSRQAPAQDFRVRFRNESVGKSSPSAIKTAIPFRRVEPIATFEGRSTWPTTRTNTREGLQRIIDAKVAGEEIVAPAVETSPRVVNLMEALKKGLDP